MGEFSPSGLGLEHNPYHLQGVSVIYVRGPSLPIFAIGTRPEIIKMAPILHSMRRRRHPFVLVHTGQHYDRQLSDVFLTELGLPTPNYHLNLKTRSPAEECSEIIVKLAKILRKTPRGLLVVEGDTNSVVSSALSANKCGVEIAHVEAGLRSHDLRMPEEHNRRVTDHLSKYLFAPTPVAKRNLEKEDCWGEIRVTGNTVIDACTLFLPLALRRSRILEKIKEEEFVLVTLHRTENVDDPRTLGGIISALRRARRYFLIPLHPRTKKRLRQYGLWSRIKNSSNIQLLPPLGYFDFLVLIKKCLFVVTDSGGIQEEATAPSLRKMVIVARKSTERPEAVSAGFAEVAGTDPLDLARAIRRTASNPAAPRVPSPYGDGKAGERIASFLAQFA